MMLVALAAVLVGGGAVYMQYSAMTEAEAKMKSLEAEVPKEEELQASLDQTNATIVDYQTRLTHLEKGVPTIAYIPTLLREIEQTGINSNMKITGVVPVLPPPTPAGVKKEKKAYEELDIDLTGRGDYNSVVALVDALRRFPKIVAVQTINLAPKVGQGSRYEYLDAKIRIRAFVFPNDQEGTHSQLKAAAATNGGAS